MSQLFKLKEWLTLEEAANYISNNISETVSVSELCSLSLNNKLQFSVYFFNGAKGKKGKLFKKEPSVEAPDSYSEEIYSFMSSLNNEIQVSEDSWVSLDSKVVSISGAWDLSMFGSESSDLARFYQQETEGVEITSKSLLNTFLYQGDDVCQLQSLHFEDKYFNNLDIEKNHFYENLYSQKLSDDEFKVLEDEFKFKNNMSLDSKSALSYQPTTSLDEYDHFFVIRTTEITRFIESLKGSTQIDKPLLSNERNTFLVLLGAICKEANIDYNKKGIASSVVLMTENIGAPLSEETVRKKLNLISDAVESRSK